MAHEVEFAIPKRPLAHADIEFDVLRDGGLFGELRMSKGGIVWAPTDHAYGYKLT